MPQRQTNINNWKNHLDKFISEILSEENPPSKILIGISSMTEIMDASGKTIRHHGFPQHLSRNYDSCEYERYQGVHIETEEYLEERKQEMEENQDE